MELKEAKSGDTVKVHFVGKLEDGTVFDTSSGKDPLQFTIGEGSLIQGFEESIVGMKVGESKNTSVPMENAFGPRVDELVVEINRDKFPEDAELTVGEQIQIPQSGGEDINVTIANISEASVTLDANHPLAGKTLLFDIELLEIA